MSTNNIPRRKKVLQTNTIKRSQSEQAFKKTSKPKTLKKKLNSTLCSRTTLGHSASTAKLKKANNKVKDKNIKLSKKNLKKTNQNKQDNSLCIKKFNKRSKQAQQELTQRKKKHLQYFMYKDVYVPIQNTQQRKIIYKIRLIDECSQKLQGKNVLNRSETKDKSTSIAKIQLIDKQIQQNYKKQNIDIFCQTQNLRHTNFNEFRQTCQQKCLAQTLSQLQFLFLPDQKNFQGFSKTEKAHYKQLLIFLAKKFQETKETQIDQKFIELKIKQRQLKQRGFATCSPGKGLPTHSLSIVSYLSNLFCFIQVNQKINFIQRMNCSYGYELKQKFQRVRAGKSTRRLAPIISQNTFWKFQSQLHQGLQFQSQIMQKSLHSHNRAIFDAVNQVLMQFQPYFLSQGQPFPWTYNFQTTFFLISEQNFPILAGQIKQKVWQYSLTLAGLILQDVGQQRYNIHIKKLFSLQEKLIRDEVKRIDQRAQMDESRTRLLNQISNYVQDEIFNQMFLFLCM